MERLERERELTWDTNILYCVGMEPKKLYIGLSWLVGAFRDSITKLAWLNLMRTLSHINFPINAYLI